MNTTDINWEQLMKSAANEIKEKIKQSGETKQIPWYSTGRLDGLYEGLLIVKKYIAQGEIND